MQSALAAAGRFWRWRHDNLYGTRPDCRQQFLDAWHFEIGLAGSYARRMVEDLRSGRRPGDILDPDG